MLLVIASCGLLISYYYRLGIAVNPGSICIGGATGCEMLANLPVAYAIFGLPNSFWGIVYFSVIIVYTIYNGFIKNTSKIFYYLFIILCISASLFSLYLALYQVKVGQYCILCIISSLCVWISSYLVITNKLMPEFKDTTSPAIFAMSILLINIAAIIGIGNFYTAIKGSAIIEQPMNENSVSRIRNLLNLNNRPFSGHQEAKLTIIEFADPTCPVCKILHEKSLKPILEEYKNVIKYYYLYAYGHCPNGEDFFAILEVCKNLNKFYECVDLLYNYQDTYYSFNNQTKRCDIDSGKLRKILNQIQITDEDFDTFYQKVDRNKIKEEVSLVMDLLKIEGTPTLLFVIGDKTYSIVGLRSGEYLKSVINRFLKK